MPFVRDTLRAAVGRIEIETTALPKLVIDDPFGEGGASGGIAAYLKPRIAVYAPDGTDPIFTSIPYGEPGPTRWPLVGAGLVAFLGWAILRR